MFNVGATPIHEQVFFFVMAQRTAFFAKGLYNFHLPRSASVITFTIKPWDFWENRNDSAIDTWLQVQKLKLLKQKQCPALNG